MLEPISRSIRASAACRAFSPRTSTSCADGLLLAPTHTAQVLLNLTGWCFMRSMRHTLSLTGLAVVTAASLLAAQTTRQTYPTRFVGMSGTYELESARGDSPDR